MLAPVAVPAATADLTAAAGGRAVAEAACLEEVCSRRKSEVICGACTAAVEAVVEEVEVLAAAFCSPCAFMLLEGASPHADVCAMLMGQMLLYHPGDRRRGPVNVCGVTYGAWVIN